MKDTSNNFQRFAELGYENLVPVIPPDAEISEGSTLFKRIGTKQDGRGKIPGIKGREGKWFSYDWQQHQTSEVDLTRWHKMGAGVGIKTGDGLIAIDADTLNEGYARIIKEEVEALIGQTPVRIGNYPKALYLVRTSEPVQYQRVEFGDERVEILSSGRFFVAHGTHPKTKKPYEWPRQIIPFDQLPVLSPEQISQLLERLRSKLPEASKVIKEGGAAEVDQASLRGDPELVEKAVRSIPNTSELFPARENYVAMGYAIRAALPDDEALAFELFSDWCFRWVGGDNAPDIVETDWRRMKPPYRRGAAWLYDLASKHGDGQFNPGEIWFEDLENPENPFTEIYQNSKNLETKTDTFDIISLADLESREPAEWLVARHVPRKSVGFVYSSPGAGKTFLVLDMALHIADGRADWHGDALNVPENAAVLYIASEGSYGFKNRVAAWKQKNGYSAKLAKHFMLIEQTINFMNAEDIGKLLRTVHAIKATGVKLVLTVVDTVSRAMPGADENLQKDMTLFVKACDAVRDAMGGAVIGVHHAGKAGDMRGSTVLLGAGDFVFRLDRKKGATVGHLDCEKQKDGPDGWQDPYVFDVVSLSENETSVTVSRADMGIGPGLKLTPETTAIVLKAMRDAWEAGAPWSKAPQTKERYAIRRMVADYGFDAADAEDLLRIWEASGLVWDAVFDRHRKRSGYQVGEIPGHTVQLDGIFS